MAEEKDLLLLFQRPNEPLFTKKDNGKAAFDVPEDFLTDRYKPILNEISFRFGEDVERRIPLSPIVHPDLSFAQQVKLTGPFSLFNQRNQKIAGELTKLFLNQPDLKTLVSVAAYVRDRVNPYLFQYSLSVAMNHREDTRNCSLPLIVQMFPDQFIDPSVFLKAREEGTLVSAKNRMHVEIPVNYTASDSETEQCMAYFREDIGVNMHHWHWHLVYPVDGEHSVVNKDRRGELFYYMHTQIIARYNVERIGNRLKRVLPLKDLQKPIREGYFPKIIRSSNNRAYPARVRNTILSDVDRPVDNAVVDVADLRRWTDRIYQAIDQGYVVDESGRQIPLDEKRGIDILGNIIEASSLSPNKKLYGNLHNEGHNVISYSHDPDARHLEDFGVMGDVSTAMRDPIFYRWHSFIDSVFSHYKNTLPPYLPAQHFEFSGVSVDSVKLQLSFGKNTQPNLLLTFWQKSDVDLSAGLDFGPEGNVYAQFTHLQHEPFEYIIRVRNDSCTTRRGTCRIFIGPKTDHRKVPLTFHHQRTLMIEMDKFDVFLKPGGNRILRRSDESSVTIPYERSFRRIGSAYKPKNGDALDEFHFCGCGWPQHMLLPKGTPEGSQFYVFVMITDYQQDTVNEEPNTNFACNDAASFCGLKDQKYPDKRAMGFPFDRRFTSDTLETFANTASNMTVGSFIVKFNDNCIDRV